MDNFVPGMAERGVGAIQRAMVPATNRRHCLASLTALASLCALTLTACPKAEASLPQLGQVGAFALVDQAGAPVSAETMRGKVWVAAFFFTHCPSICPRITRRMRALQVEASHSSRPITLVSFSVDPENDSPPVLAAYAKRFEADLRSWSFLTGELSTVQHTVVDGFKLALDGKADPTAENGGIIHGSHLVLVDRALAIRGYYRTDDDSAMKQILIDAARL